MVGGIELSGHDVPLTSLLRFLTRLGTTGRLDLWNERHGVGIVFLEDGHVVGGIFGPESGVTALETIALVLPHAQFSFSDRPRPPARNVAMETTTVLSHLTELAEESQHLVLPSQEAVPRPLVHVQARLEGQSLPDDDLARVLQALDGRRTVGELAGELGLGHILISLAHLEELRFISIESGPQPEQTESLRHRLQKNWWPFAWLTP